MISTVRVVQEISQGDLMANWQGDPPSGGWKNYVRNHGQPLKITDVQIMKTTELTDAQLDYWVAKAIRYMPGHEFRLGLTPETAIILRNLESGEDVRWQPSTDWAQGGPIIDRMAIALVPWREGNATIWCAYMPNKERGPELMEDGYFEVPARNISPTALIAAMRAYVESVFGEEVPDES